MERKLGWLAIPNLTIYIITGQVLAYALSNEYWGTPEIRGTMSLIPAKVLQGEFWRLLSFVFIPPLKHPIFMLVGWYVFYFIGSSLEGAWGAFKYTIYLLLSLVIVVVSAFLVGFVFGIQGYPVTNALMGSSIFFAFACLFPDFEMRIYFILPVKVKWMGYFLAGILVLQLFALPLPLKLLTLAGLMNFFLFFGGELKNRIQSGSRQRKRVAEKNKDAETPFHVCAQCGATDLSHPDREFRYRGEEAICSECISENEKSGIPEKE
ncbi:hypothetical protein MLD52_03060 [Puniceicoccaceae bacterium K14]|nr:hypothetical protein [Puniceicoccaceae bacterium K14]